MPQLIQVVGVRVAAGDGEDAGARNIRDGVGDQGGGAVIGNDRGQPVDQAKPLVGTRQQQTATTGTDLAPIERGSDLFLADTLQMNGRSISAIFAGMADSVRARGVASTTKPCAIPDGCTIIRQRIPAMG